LNCNIFKPHVKQHFLRCPFGCKKDCHCHLIGQMPMSPPLTPVSENSVQDLDLCVASLPGTPPDLMCTSSQGSVSSPFAECSSPILSQSRIPSTTSKKKFQCSLCESSFSRNHDLKRHSRIHTGVKPYKCNDCGKAFTRQDALNRHSLVKGCNVN
jgi:uncharacterized Zn-finger protein